MFNTTNIYNLNGSAGQPRDPKIDAWTKVIAVAAVVTMLLTAVLVVFTIMASQRPTLVMRHVTIPTPVLIQQPPQRQPTIMLCSTRGTVSVASEPLGYPSPAWTLDTFYSR
jgi:hypothetical protein